MSDVLRDYQPLHFILMLFGICPFAVKTPSENPIRCRASITAYQCVHCASGLLMAYAYWQSFRNDWRFLFRDVRSVTALAQAIIVTLVHFTAMFMGLWTRENQAGFFRCLTRVSGRIDTVCGHNLRRKIAFGLVLIVLNVGLVLWVRNFQRSLEPPPDRWYNRLIGAHMLIMVATGTLAMMHVILCAQLLGKRFDEMCNSLLAFVRPTKSVSNVDLKENLQCLDELCLLKEMFQGVFGLLIFLNLIADSIIFMFVLYLLFMQLNAGHNQFTIPVLMALSFILPSIFKNVLVVFSVEELTRKVGKYMYANCENTSI